MADFGTVTLPDFKSSLLDLASIDQDINKTRVGSNIAATGTQDLADRDTLRGLAPGLAAGDPQAGAQALTLGERGVAAVGGLAGMHADARSQLGNTLAVTGALSGAILAAPAEQRAALWQQFRPTMLQAGAVQAPVDYPGDDYLNTHRVGAVSVQEQLKQLENVPTTDPTRTPLSPPAGARVGPGGVVAGGATGGDYSSRVVGNESGGNPNAKNPLSTATGAGQFIDSTWLDILKRNRPDLTTGRSDADILAMRRDPALSRSMIGVYGKENGAALQAAGLPVDDGSLYLAHGFGSQGAATILKAPSSTPMEQLFPASVFAANPNYRGKTAGDIVSLFRTKMGVGAPAAVASAPLPSTPPRTQVASAAGTAGMPATASDVSGVVPTAPPDAALPVPPTPPSASSAPPAPASDEDVVNVDHQGGEQSLPNGTRFRVAGGPVETRGDSPLALGPDGRLTVPGAPVVAPAAPVAAAPAVAPLAPAITAAAPAPRPALPAIANPNALLGMAPAGPAPVNSLFSTAAPPVAPAAATGQSGVAPLPQGTLYQRGAPIAVPGSPGYVMATSPDGTRGAVRVGQPEVVIKDSGSVRGFYDKHTGALIRTEAIPDHSRITTVPSRDGTVMLQSGKPVGEPIPFSGRPEQKEAYQADLKQASGFVASAQVAQATLPRLNEMAQLATQLATGPTADLRAKGAAMLEGFGVDPAVIQRWTGMSSGSAAQEFVKLGITAAGAASKADVGANNGIESVRLYQQANPGLQLLPDANKRITNMMRVASQATVDYSQGALTHFAENEKQFLGGKDYAPLTSFNRDWQAQNNPGVYAAATGILNGDPFDKWSAKVSPDEARRAAAIAARIDPTTMVPGRGGGMIPARNFMPQGK